MNSVFADVCIASTDYAKWPNYSLLSTKKRELCSQLVHKDCALRLPEQRWHTGGKTNKSIAMY